MRYIFGILALGLSVFLGGCKEHIPQESAQDEFSGGSPASRGAMMAPYQRTDNAEPGVVIVKFKRQAAPVALTRSADGMARTGVQAVDAVGSDLSVAKIERVFPYVERSEPFARKHGLDLWYRITYDPAKASLRAAVDSYCAVEELDWVETVKYAVFTDGTNSTQAQAVDPAQMVNSRVDNVSRIFNDPFLPRQWWFDAKNTTIADVNPQAGINMDVAWEKYCGSRDIIIGVMDGGVKWTHQDLADNMWVNKGEIPDNGIDDDGNGYVDDVYGYDFVQWNGEVEIAWHDHGTHVAGIIAAVNNNGKGVSSVAGGTGNNDGVRIMTCQLFKGVKSATNDKIAEGIKYAADNGAIISQNSWGFPGPDERAKVVEDAIDYFIAQAGNAELFPDSPMRGGLVIFASGNLAHEIDQQKVYPQAYESVIAVSGTDQSRKRAGFACYGDWVEISAPSGRDPEEGDFEDIKQHFITSTIATSNYTDNKTYGFFTGTSQACPMVTGVAALLIQANKGKSNSEIKQLLLSSVSSLESTEPNFALMGSGLLDASKYLFANKNTDAPNAIQDLQLIEGSNDIYSLQWTVPTDKSGDWIDTYTLYFSDSEITNANLADAKKVVFNQFRRKPAGQTIKLDLADSMGMDMKTTTYFAIVSSDQWANGSGLSNVVEHLVATGGNPLAFPLGATAASVLKMSWPKDFVGSKSINVYDRSARRVMQQTVTDAAARGYDLSVSALASGNYTVEVVGSGATYRRSFRKL